MPPFGQALLQNYQTLVYNSAPLFPAFLMQQKTFACGSKTVINTGFEVGGAGATGDVC